MSIAAIPEHTVAAMAKDVAAGDYRKFFRLGAATLAGIFVGRLAEAVVEGVLDRVWKRADAEKAQAVAATAQAAEVARITAALRDALRTELVAVADKLDALRDAQAAAHRNLAALADTAERSAEDIAHIRTRIDALTAAAAEQARPPEELLVHLATATVRVPPFSDAAEIVFTVHNFTRGTLKLRALTLTLTARTQIDEVQLPRAGEPIANVELACSVAGRHDGTFELLASLDTQFVLQPEDADGFRLRLTCDDGYHYRFTLGCTAQDIRAAAAWTSTPRTFDVTAPITRVETLRARKGA